MQSPTDKSASRLTEEMICLSPTKPSTFEHSAPQRQVSVMGGGSGQQRASHVKPKISMHTFRAWKDKVEDIWYTRSLVTKLCKMGTHVASNQDDWYLLSALLSWRVVTVVSRREKVVLHAALLSRAFEEMKRAWDNTRTAYSSSASSSQLVPTEPGLGALEMESSALTDRDGDTFTFSISPDIGEELQVEQAERQKWSAKLLYLLKQKIAAQDIFLVSTAFADLCRAARMQRSKEIFVLRLNRRKELRIGRTALWFWASLAKEESLCRKKEVIELERTVEQKCLIEQRDSLRSEVESELDRHLSTCKDVHNMLEVCAQRSAFDRLKYSCLQKQAVRDAWDASLTWGLGRNDRKWHTLKAWNAWTHARQQVKCASELQQSRAVSGEVLSVLRGQSVVVVLESERGIPDSEASMLRARIAKLLCVAEGVVGVLGFRQSGRLAEVSLGTEAKGGEEGRSALELGEELVERWSAGPGEAESRDFAGKSGMLGARVVGRMDPGICGLLAGWCVEIAGLEAGAARAVQAAEARVRQLESECAAREAECGEQREAASRARERVQKVEREKEELAARVQEQGEQVRREAAEQRSQQLRIEDLQAELKAAAKESCGLREKLEEAECRGASARAAQAEQAQQAAAALAEEQEAAERLRHLLAEREEEAGRCETRMGELQGALVALEVGLQAEVAEAAEARRALKRMEEACGAGAAAMQQVRVRQKGESTCEGERKANAEVVQVGHLQAELGSALRALWTVRQEAVGARGEVGLVVTDTETVVSEKIGENRRAVAVLAIRAESSAAKSGQIGVGDELVAVGGESVASMSIDQIRGMLQGKPGSKIGLQFQEARSTRMYSVSLSYLKLALGGLAPEALSREVCEVVRWSRDAIADASRRLQSAEDERARVQDAREIESRAIRESLAQLRVSGADKQRAVKDDRERTVSRRSVEPGGFHRDGTLEREGVLGEVVAAVAECNAAFAVNSASIAAARAETRAASIQCAVSLAQRKLRLPCAFRAWNSETRARQRRARRSCTAFTQVGRASSLALAWAAWASHAIAEREGASHRVAVAGHERTLLRWTFRAARSAGEARRRRSRTRGAVSRWMGAADAAALGVVWYAWAHLVEAATRQRELQVEVALGRRLRLRWAFRSMRDALHGARESERWSRNRAAASRMIAAATSACALEVAWRAWALAAARRRLCAGASELLLQGRDRGRKARCWGVWAGRCLGPRATLVEKAAGRDSPEPWAMHTPTGARCGSPEPLSPWGKGRSIV